VVKVEAIPDGWMGLDIGPESLETFKKELLECKTVVWNGPMGVFEFEAFSKGTFGVAHTLAEVTKNGGTTIIGGTRCAFRDLLSRCLVCHCLRLYWLNGLYCYASTKMQAATPWRL
jgi:hypothetical protein